MVSPKPGAPAPAVNAQGFTIPHTLLPASALPRASREGLIDVEFLLKPVPADLDVPLHWTSRFFTPMVLCTVTYCIAMALFAGSAREVMAMRFGPVSGSCLFVFSQLLVAWIAGAWYVRAAGIFASNAQPVPSEARNS
jgi:uncharacterized membrane protein (DUF485 family)